ncbi:unnamed protein product [Rotaria socialis]
MDLSTSSILKNSTEYEKVNSSQKKNENVSTTTPCISIDGKNFELRELENRLKYGLQKCKMKDMTQLDERIKRTEERIQQYEHEDRNEEAEKERKYVNDLKQLKILAEENSSLLLSYTIDKLDLSELENRLEYGFEKCKIKDVIQLTERIKRTEKRIEQYEDENRIDAAAQEMKYLRDLEQLKQIAGEIFFRKSTETNSKNDDRFNQMTSVKEIVDSAGYSSTFHEEKEKQEELKNLLDDLVDMPCCAEKTIVELLAHFQQKLLTHSIGEKTPDSIILTLEKLQGQIQKEELSSEQIRNYFQDLNRTVYNEDYSSAIRILTKILKKIRPLCLQEIQRLVEKTKTAATLINNKDITLLVGATGCGKSTTIQFLSGAKMKDTRVEIAPGKFLEHITIDGPIRNPGLNNVTSSPLSKSETRYIVPVTIQLRDIFGHYETGEIILCDTPGYEDTEGPEVDIANSTGIVEALNNCKSVKILALTSYRSLGDKGEGIQNLAHLLNKMINRIEDRLYGILYAFTKYPATMDIHATLTSIKSSKLDVDPILRSDHAFVAVLTDMIDKTKHSTEKIDPIHDDPKILIKKLNRLNGICYPDEVFRFSISGETQNTILNHVQTCKLSIVCAMKHKDIDLLVYYFNNFKILNGLLKENFVRDAYEDSIRFVTETIEQYSHDTMKKFNRNLSSQDGLKDEEIEEYKIAYNYMEKTENLREHLGSTFLSSEILIENILCELEKISSTLKEQDLCSSSIGIYLNNINLLKNSFKQLESHYIKVCQDCSERFQSTLIESIAELISKNEFQRVAERMFIIWKCLPVLNHHLNGQIEKNYCDIIKMISQHLISFSEKVNIILIKITLNNNDIEILKNYMILLRTAEETTLLQEQISKYIEIMKAKNEISIETIKDLGQIHEEFILKIVTYFDEINSRINDLLKKDFYYTLENVEHLVMQMEMIRTLPNIESKTVQTFYQTIQNICSCIQQMQRNAEDLLHTLDCQPGMINFRYLARSLLQLKKTQWIDRIYPGTYDLTMRHIREELEERAYQLENSLKKLDFTLKSPQNILLAQNIIEKIESLNVLESTIPQLEKYRQRINQYFIQATNEVFDQIKKTFDLTDKTIDHFKQELIILEKIKNEYDHFYPSRSYLRQFGYTDINILNLDIENLKFQQEEQLKEREHEKRQLESQLNDLNRTIRHNILLNPLRAYFGMIHRFISNIIIPNQQHETQLNQYLKQVRYEILNKTMMKNQEDYNKLLELIEQKNTEFNTTLNHLESIKEEYLSLLASSNSISPNEIDFLQEKGQTTYEILEQTIQVKTNILIEYEKYKQTYYFTDKLNVSVANNALIYMSNCKKLWRHPVNEVSEDINEFLRKYLEEYGNFLDKEFERNFTHITNIDESYCNQYLGDLEIRCQEISSLDSYLFVFESLRGADKIDRWHRQLFNYYHVLENEMEICKISGRYQELRTFLMIAQSLSRLDCFGKIIVADNRFRHLYKQYQNDIAIESREAYIRVIDCISNGDYSNADLSLSDFIEYSSNSKFLAHIKHDLESSLSKVIKNTKNCAHWLDGRIERKEDNRAKIREVNENIEKIQIVLNRHSIMTLIDEKSKIILLNFQNEINEILSKAILNGIHKIHMFIDQNSFLEAEHSMENLIPAHNGLVDHFTSKFVSNKIEELKLRLNTLDTDILQHYDFVDTNNYSMNPPKDLLAQLKKVASNGYPRYNQVYNSLMGKIRIDFDLAIDKVRVNSLNDRYTKIQSIKYAFLFLPEELKPIFQLQIDELNLLNIDEQTPFEFD